DGRARGETSLSAAVSTRGPPRHTPAAALATDAGCGRPTARRPTGLPAGSRVPPRALQPDRSGGPTSAALAGRAVLPDLRPGRELRTRWQSCAWRAVAQSRCPADGVAVRGRAARAG